ncbi:SRPBCC family protein [Sandarakinorhabdus oryzae]|uniref:SRPBCC family protein n=1 Tax=Sandarakinorhabdus oryzae TaxID=2675220 RepID=UPI0012E19D3D|nr:SRPBCC family protein [Sandarakinorhabdus oryzae]
MHFGHEMETSASAGAVWALWLDVARWGEWDLGLASATLDGPMAVGACGTIIDRAGRRSPFTVTVLEPGRCHEFSTRLPLGALVVRRTILQAQPCRFRHDVRFTGIGGRLLAPILGRDFRAKLPPTMAALAALAEREHP